MATNRTLSDLPPVTGLADADITHLRQGATDKSSTMTILSGFVNNESSTAPTVHNITGNYTVPAVQRKQIVVVTTGSNDYTITLGAPGSTILHAQTEVYKVDSGSGVVTIAGGGIGDIILKEQGHGYKFTCTDDGVGGFQWTSNTKWDFVTPRGFKAGCTLSLSATNLQINPGYFQYFDANNVSQIKEIPSTVNVTDEATVADNFIYFVYYDNTTDEVKVSDSIRTAIPVGGPAIQTAYTAILNTGDANVNFDKLKNYYHTGANYRILGFVTKLVGTWDFINYADFFTGTNCLGQNDLGWFERRENTQRVYKRDSVLFTTSSGTGRTAIPYYASQLYNLPVAWVAPAVATDLYFDATFSKDSGFPFFATPDNSSLTQLRIFAYSESSTDQGKFNYEVQGKFYF